MHRKIETKTPKIIFVIMAVSLAPFLVTATGVSAQVGVPNNSDENGATDTTSANSDTSVAGSNISQTGTSTITIHDKINSTYAVSKNDVNGTSILTRAIRDRVSDITHTVALNNATVTVSSAKITNGLTNVSTVTSNNNITTVRSDIRRLANDILDTVQATPGSSLVELNVISDITCVSNTDRSFADCNIDVTIGRR